MASNLKSAATATLFWTTYANDWQIYNEGTDPQIWNGNSIKPGSVLVREITEVDPTMADDIVLASDKTYTDPTASTESFTGTWVNSQTVALNHSDNNRNWATIRQTLTKVATKAGASFVYSDLPNPVRQYAYELLSEYDPTAWQGSKDDIILSFLYLDPTSRADIETMAMAVPLTINAVVQVPAGYVEKLRKVVREDKGDRTLTLTILYTKATWTNTATSVVTAYSGWNSEIGHTRQKTVTLYGVPVASAESVSQALAQAAEASNWMPAEGGWTRSDDGSATVRQNYEYQIAAGTYDAGGGATEGVFERREYEIVGQRSATGTKTYYDLTPSDADTIITALDTATTVTIDGVTYQKRAITKLVHKESGLVDVRVDGYNGYETYARRGWPKDQVNVLLRKGYVVDDIGNTWIEAVFVSVYTTHLAAETMWASPTNPGTVAGVDYSSYISTTPPINNEPSKASQVLEYADNYNLWKVTVTYYKAS